MVYVFATSPKIGSISTMFEKLQQAGRDYPIEGNLDGSYLTFRSKSGLIFMGVFHSRPFSPDSR